MTFSLHSATVVPFQQILATIRGLLEKAEAHCSEQGIAAEDIIQARLAPDMLPFAYQVKSTAVHSIGAIEGVRSGVFSPDRSTPPESFADLSRMVADASTALAALDADEINGLVGRPMRIEISDYRADFLTEEFLFSFSKPNFYFHATTAYGILRAKGLAIGKMDYLGPLAFRKV